MGFLSPFYGDIKSPIFPLNSYSIHLSPFLNEQIKSLLGFYKDSEKNNFSILCCHFIYNKKACADWKAWQNQQRQPDRITVHKFSLKLLYSFAETINVFGCGMATMQIYFNLKNWAHSSLLSWKISKKNYGLFSLWENHAISSCWWFRRISCTDKKVPWRPFLRKL